MSNNWMVRAGHGGVYIEDFEKGYVAIGWSQLGVLTQYASDSSFCFRVKAVQLSLHGDQRLKFECWLISC